MTQNTNAALNTIDNIFREHARKTLLKVLSPEMAEQVADAIIQSIGLDLQPKVDFQSGNSTLTGVPNSPQSPETTPLPAEKTESEKRQQRDTSRVALAQAARRARERIEAGNGSPEDKKLVKAYEATKF